MPSPTGFLIYRIFYGDFIVYVGRTKQPLQNRMRGHFFQKPMHRTIDISQVTKIQYASLSTEADMNLYEIYYILKWHPPLNVDDKTKDYPTVFLPEVQWKDWNAPIFDRWKTEITERRSNEEKNRARYREIFEEIRVTKSLRRTGQISEDECYDRISCLNQEQQQLDEKYYGRTNDSF